VIPLLQRRGLFRTTYAGKTLREHYGLAWPKSVFEEVALKPPPGDLIRGMEPKVSRSARLP
jgi:hypothetical protein